VKGREKQKPTLFGMSVLLFSLTNFKKKIAPAGKKVVSKGFFDQLEIGAIKTEYHRYINKTNTHLDL